MDITAAYDTVNHRRLLTKILELTEDAQVTEFLSILLINHHFFVKLQGKQKQDNRKRTIIEFHFQKVMMP